MVFNYNPINSEFETNDPFVLKNSNKIYGNVGDILEDVFPDNFGKIEFHSNSISASNLYILNDYSIGISNNSGGIEPLGFISEIKDKNTGSVVAYLEKFNFDETGKVNGEFAHEYISFKLTDNYSQN